MNGSKYPIHREQVNQRSKLAEDHVERELQCQVDCHDYPALPRFTIVKNKKKVLSPAIFIDKSASNKPEGTVTAPLLLFEQLLALVCKCYYKYNFQPDAWLREMETTIQDSPPAKVTEASLPSLRIHKMRGRGRGSRGTKLIIRSTAKPLDRRTSAYKRQVADLEKNQVDRSHLLDYLVSPLKVDHVFGRVIRTLVGQGNRHF
jgi:hypothetical protein